VNKRPLPDPRFSGELGVTHAFQGEPILEFHAIYRIQYRYDSSTLWFQRTVAVPDTVRGWQTTIPTLIA
jgi:hypothetical protein